MNFIQCASAASVWKGYYYYEENKAIVTQRVSDSIIRGTVSGSSAKSYSVEIDLAHPKRSKCNCPHADGKLIVCKHKVALYFTAFPEAVLTCRCCGNAACAAAKLRFAAMVY